MSTTTTAAVPANSVTELEHLGLIRVTGEDGRTFLQGQLTNDVNKVTPQLAQFSSYCSPKGRMLTAMLVFEHQGDLYLQLPRERLEDVFKRLQMFVLRARATLEDATASLALLGITGGKAAAALPAAPSTALACDQVNDLTVIRLPGDPARFEVIGPAAAIASLRERLPTDTAQTDTAFWSLMDIRAGIANVWQQTVDGFVPQMTNLQLIGGISFTKGCYTGQEVVARMQYLGKLKRRMYRARIATDEQPAPGTEIYSPSSESGQGAGRVVEAAASPDGGYEALVVLQISTAEAGDARLRDANGPALELLDLPYAFDQD